MTSNDSFQPSAGSLFKGVWFALAAFATFSTHDALIKSVQGHSVFQVAFFVVLFSFVPFTFFLAVDQQKKSLRPVLPGLVALRCLFTLGSLLCAFYAFSLLPMTEVYPLIFAAPVLITILAIPVLGEKVRLIRWVAIFTGLLGVLIVLRPGQSSLSIGHLAGLGAATCVAFTAIVTRKIGAREHSGTLILYPMLVNFVVTGLFVVFNYQPMDGRTVLTLAAIGLLSVVAQTLLITAYRVSEAQFVAPMQYSQMIWAIIFGMLFFGDAPDRYVLIGSAVIILSGLLFVWREVVASVTQPILRTRNLRMAAGPQAVPSESDRTNPGSANER